MYEKSMKRVISNHTEKENVEKNEEAVKKEEKKNG